MLEGRQYCTLGFPNSGGRPMSDYIWYLIMATVVGTAFLPLLLRQKCTRCKKRILKQINQIEAVDPDFLQNEPKFSTYFWCKPCDIILRRERTGPLEIISEAEQVPQAVS